LHIDDDIRRDIDGVNIRLQVGQLDDEIASELARLAADEGNINAAMAANPATSAGYAARLAEI
jgi:hypothetical protein